MIDFEKYINQEILISHLGKRTLMEGVLQEIIPAAASENYVDTLVVETEDKTLHINTNEILQFFPKKEWDDRNTRYYYVIFRYGKTSKSKEHIYMSHDYSIKPGDKVLVWQDWMYVGNVIRTGYFARGMTPYPLEKTWFIQQRVYDRIDFMQYKESKELIEGDNLYKDNYLNHENDYKQFVGKVDYLYEWLKAEQVELLTERNANTRDSIIGNVTYELDWEWCESNQVEVFYRTVIICAYMAQHNCYDKFYFDKYKCLSLIYKHDDFDEFLLFAEKDKAEINKDVEGIDAYLHSIIK